MPDYKKGKIYVIKSNISSKAYYGSTTLDLIKRLQHHKYDAYRKNEVSSKSIIFEGDYYIELVENFPCDTKKELTTRERYFIENNVCLNKVIPTRTLSEYRQQPRWLNYRKEYDKKRLENPKYNADRREKYKNDKEYREKCKERAIKTYYSKKK